ncbi:MAG: GNAT family N-acetyltransferase [Hyphomicrobiaceae bacterium]|nr:GNAT family N-acetyltransferase [Hyphomicrobiaceae bacterium]MCC0009636.1 GNAT family N-acetyltransferase [Hyphomicrobiaceae bacterium]
MSLHIRLAKPTDIEALLALYKKLNPGDELLSVADAVEQLEHLAKFTGSGVLVGIVGDEIVTSCTLIVIPNLTRGGRPYGLIENVVTHSAWRRRGFGKRILRRAVETAWESDCYKVMLMTGSKTPATLAFYEAAGFSQNKTGFQVRR